MRGPTGVSVDESLQKITKLLFSRIRWIMSHEPQARREAASCTAEHVKKFRKHEQVELERFFVILLLSDVWYNILIPVVNRSLYSKIFPASPVDTHLCFQVAYTQC